MLVTSGHNFILFQSPIYSCYQSKFVYTNAQCSLGSCTIHVKKLYKYCAATPTTYIIFWVIN